MLALTVLQSRPAIFGDDHNAVEQQAVDMPLRETSVWSQK